MNRSGEVVQKIMSFYRIPPADIVVVHDDLDIEIGNYKITADSSSAGHNGVQSIISSLGTQEFKRAKIGVEKEGGRALRKTPGEKFVLENFSPEEYEKIIKLAAALKDLLI